ncbi:hypothetical protein ACXZ9C_11745 [Streptococcus agalactiae]
MASRGVSRRVGVASSSRGVAASAWRRVGAWRSVARRVGVVTCVAWLVASSLVVVGRGVVRRRRRRRVASSLRRVGVAYVWFRSRSRRSWRRSRCGH